MSVIERRSLAEQVTLLDLFMAGRYRLHELISRRLPLSEINEAFDLLRNGEVKRSVIVYG